MKKTQTKILIALVTFAVTLTATSVLAADCVSTVIKSEDGTYQHCEVIRGTDIQFLDTESTSEEACKQTCTGLSEMEQVAAESRAFDEAAGLAVPE